MACHIGTTYSNPKCFDSSLPLDFSLEKKRGIQLSLVQVDFLELSCLAKNSSYTKSQSLVSGEHNSIPNNGHNHPPHFGPIDGFVNFEIWCLWPVLLCVGEGTWL